MVLERERASALFARVDKLEGVAATLAADDPRRATLRDVAFSELNDADLIRPGIAASLLGLTEKTVRSWVSEGVLTTGSDTRRLLLNAVRLYEVLVLVRDLREAGKQRGLLDEVYRRLSDSSLLSREDLQASLAELAQGQGTVVRDAGAI